MEEQENINVKRNMSDNHILGPILVSVEKSDQSSYIHVDKDEFKIGRGRANDEIIAHVSISRQHCILKRTTDNNWTIQDVSSSGTFLNGNHLQQGVIKNLEIGDLIQLGPLPEFLYKFNMSGKNYEPVAKKPRINMPQINMNDIVMKQKTFDESQQMERNHLAEQMKAKQNEQLVLEHELDKLLKDRDTALGEKDDLNKQINVLEKNIEDVKAAEINLQKLNKELSERLDKERQEFETKLNEEKRKVEEALEMSRKEKEILENNMRELEKLRNEQEIESRRQLEKLRNEQEIECKKLTESLDEEKKTAEKLQSEKTAFAQKLKEMEDALTKIEAKANELQNTLEQQSASKALQVVALGTVAENVEIVGESNLTILDTIDLTVDASAESKAAEVGSNVDSANAEVFNKVGDIMDEQLTCSICSELFVTALTLNCTHTFCQYCINTWMKKKKECPVCRTGITAMNRSLVLDNFIDKMVENLSAEYKKRRTEIVEERRENERLAHEAGTQGGGRRGRGRRGGNNANANTNPNPNRPGNAPAAATSGTNTTGNDPSRTERTDDIQHRGPEARRNPDWNYASGSSNQHHQQPATTGSTSNYQQTPATAQSTGTTTQQTNDDDDTSTWSSSSDGDTASNFTSYSNSQTSEDPEGHATGIENITDGDQDSDDHSTVDSWGGMDYGYDDEFWSDQDQSDDDYVDGVPGAPYGGYGSCYSCGKHGHWSPGCPFR